MSFKEQRAVEMVKLLIERQTDEINRLRDEITQLNTALGIKNGTIGRLTAFNESLERESASNFKELCEEQDENIRLRARIAELEAQQTQEHAAPDVLFDGFAVLNALSDKAKQRTSAENVSDVLDAVVKLLRSEQTDTQQPPARQVPVRWMPMDTAPKDGTLLRLLIEFSSHAIEDEEGPLATIGVNQKAHTGEDVWQFVGWDWEQDCFTGGLGNPVGWLPMLAAAPAQPAAQGQKEVQRLREALEEIADPIKFMRARLEDGEQLNGVYAIQMAESGSYLREIAKRAIAASTGQEE